MTIGCEEAGPIRQRVYIVFRKWITEGKLDADLELSTLLWRLLGRGIEGELAYRPYFVPSDELTEAEAQLCLALASDNGWAIYKMLEAQHSGD